MKYIKVKFWGVRGSIPTPGPSTIRYGGNTPCIEVQFQDGPLFILDAGTGIRELGKQLLKRNQPVNAYIFLSHYHWDHIQGLPFFRPAYQAGNRFTIIGSDDTNVNLNEIISFQMNPTYFPVAIEDMMADIQFRSIGEETFEIEGVRVQSMYLNHPGYALGFRFTYQGRHLVYISDNEPFRPFRNPETPDVKQVQKKKLEEIFDNFVENKDETLIRFCEHADLLIHDSQFLPEEYQEKITWGHSPFDYTVDLAVKSMVKQLILFHHDPLHDDRMIDRIQALSQQRLKESGYAIPCWAAQEGMIIEI